MISMRYARNLAEGHGLVWNAGGERVQGFSNPGVTLVMAGLHRLPLAPRHVSLLFQLVALALQSVSLVLLWRLARRIAPEHAGLAPAAALAFALCAPQICAPGRHRRVGAWLRPACSPRAGASAGRALAVARRGRAARLRELFAWPSPRLRSRAPACGGWPHAPARSSGRARVAVYCDVMPGTWC
jgi:hypothetical protein